MLKRERERMVVLQHWWAERMHQEKYPLREKMALFWHNHFVSAIQKVKLPWLLYEQNQLFREYAFGNFKTLTKKVLYNNAMLVYLDNVQNKARTPNENLSRELLELFTLGIGNYTEQDIKEGARALAGLNLGENGGRYYAFWQDNTTKHYLGREGNFTADDLVDIIFEQKEAATRITTKLLRFFVTDMPDEKLIREHAAFLRENDFEIQPLIEKIVTDKCIERHAGESIKDPLSYALQVLNNYGIRELPAVAMFGYLRNQGMELFNPPNVKGWEGGRQWLSSDKLIQRLSIIELMSAGKPFARLKLKAAADDSGLMAEEKEAWKQMPHIVWNRKAVSSEEIIAGLIARNLSQSSPEIETDSGEILRYDFDPNQENAEAAVARLAAYLFKTPEFQVY